MNCPFCDLPAFISRLGVVWCPEHGVIAEFLTTVHGKIKG